MNIGQLKRINLNDKSDMDFFIQMFEDQASLGPANLSELLTDAFLSEDENLSVISWFLIMRFLGNFNNELPNLSNQKIFTTNKRVKAYISLIKNIFKLFKEKYLILPHFKNNVMWARKIMNEIMPKTKAQIYAVDMFLSNELKNYNYASLEKSLESEGLKVKIMTSAYYEFMTCS